MFLCSLLSHLRNSMTSCVHYKRYFIRQKRFSLLHVTLSSMNRTISNAHKIVDSQNTAFVGSTRFLVPGSSRPSRVISYKIHRLSPWQMISCHTVNSNPKSQDQKTWSTLWTRLFDNTKKTHLHSMKDKTRLMSVRWRLPGGVEDSYLTCISQSKERKMEVMVATTVKGRNESNTELDQFSTCYTPPWFLLEEDSVRPEVLGTACPTRQRVQAECVPAMTDGRKTQGHVSWVVLNFLDPRVWGSESVSSDCKQI